MACQPVLDYFMTTGLGIEFIACTYLHFWSSFSKGNMILSIPIKYK